MKGKGWHRESRRHALARKGIKTTPVKRNNSAKLYKSIKKSEAAKETWRERKLFESRYGAADEIKNKQILKNPYEVGRNTYSDNPTRHEHVDSWERSDFSGLQWEAKKENVDNYSKLNKYNNGMPGVTIYTLDPEGYGDRMIEILYMTGSTQETDKGNWLITNYRDERTTRKKTFNSALKEAKEIMETENLIAVIGE